MRLGFKFFTGGGFTTLWTTLTDQDRSRQTRPWGRISEAKLSYADFEITECSVSFVQPSDSLIRALLSIVVAEPTALDGGLQYLSASLWVQDPRFGYDPQPIFYGLILNLSYQDGPPARLTVTLHDFMRLKIIERDIQDYQNLTDSDIAMMLAVQLNRATNGEDGRDVISLVRIDPAAIAQKRTSAGVGAVRRWQARLLDASAYDKLKMYAFRLGFKISPMVKVNSGGEEYTEIQIQPVDGALERVAGTYVRGGGEVISFSAQYDPPGPVMQRNVMNKRFDAINEIFMLENAKACGQIDAAGNVIDKNGDALPIGSIKGPTVLQDVDGRPLTLPEYQAVVGPAFKDTIQTLGYSSQAPLTEYNKKISFRKGIQTPTAAPNPAQANTSTPAADAPAFQENLADAGALYWRITGKLETRFNPFITTTDYLQLQGWGVWDANWAIRTFTHTLNDSPRTTYDLTFGDGARVSG